MKALFLIGKVVTVVLLLIFMQIRPLEAARDLPPVGYDVPAGTTTPGFCKPP
ncbi:hypothetical protein ES288_D10G260200v1 [Gossypium darwinii]|uniref:Uncharacterized protein n=1 Tax=Gossypium darwinii TaxID=34276 RepID=A0A5D2B2G8_GOSDA|nr:hypothetical protein ES288_D10G260200v1 [Gossypium darwinii]